MVAIRKLQPIGILMGKDALLIQLVGKANGIPGADGVHSKIVAQLVSRYGCFDSCIIHRAAKCIRPARDMVYLAASR